MAFLIPKLLSRRFEGAARHFFKTDGYNKYGLYHDDLLGGYYDEHSPMVAEAYRRLLIDQPEQHDLRVYRGLRANQLKIQKQILPEEEWTTFEEDQTKGRYLQPYLEQLEKEDLEKRNWAAAD